MGLAPQLAAQARVPLAPRFEVPADRVEKPGLALGLFMEGRPAEETGAQLCVPADVVPLAHLILEEPRQQEALRARHFHHQAVAEQGRVRHKVVEQRAEIRGSGPFGVGLRGDLSVVRQHTGVVKQLLSIDTGLGDVPEACEEELQDVPMIGREQFLQWFIKEQVEEVSSMSSLLTVVERAQANPLLAEEYLARESAAEAVDPTAPHAAGGAL